jgi:hypothetical protein
VELYPTASGQPAQQQGVTEQQSEVKYG